MGPMLLVHFPSEEAFGLVVGEVLARELKFFGARLGGIAEIAGDAPDALFDLYSHILGGAAVSPNPGPAWKARFPPWLSMRLPMRAT